MSRGIAKGFVGFEDVIEGKTVGHHLAGVELAGFNGFDEQGHAGGVHQTRGQGGVTIPQFFHMEEHATRAGTISVDLLRHPLPERAQYMIDKAQRAAQAGDHVAAIELFKNALQQTVSLLPRNPINRSNLGLSLAIVGQFERAEQELRQALQLDAKNDTTRRLLAVVEANHRLRHHE